MGEKVFFNKFPHALASKTQMGGWLTARLGNMSPLCLSRVAVDIRVERLDKIVQEGLMGRIFGIGERKMSSEGL